MVFGPYLAFRTGPYAATFTMSSGEADPSAIVAHLDVTTSEGGRILADRDVYAHEFPADSESLTFLLPFYTRDTWPIEARVYFTGQSKLGLHSIAITSQTESSSSSYPGLLTVLGWGLVVIIAGLLSAQQRGATSMESISDEERMP